MKKESKRVYVYIMEPEIWKDIDGDKLGIKNVYQISNHGRIRNAETGHILSVNLNNFGYRYTKIRNIYTKKLKTILLYRLTAEYFCDKHDSLSKNTVNHIDEDRANDYYENLEWVTQSENFWWSSYKSTNFGETATKNIYPESLIRSICQLLEDGDGSPTSIMHRLHLLDKYDKQKIKKLILHLKFKDSWRQICNEYKYDYTRSTTIL